MNKERLLKLADLLESDADNPVGVKFDLGTWLNPDDQEANAMPKLNCGTAACAVGLACLSPAFNAEGLSFREGGFCTRFTPTFGAENGFNAVNSFFQIDQPASRWLFVETSYPPDQRIGADGERSVAMRIRDFVAGKVRASA